MTDVQVDSRPFNNVVRRTASTSPPSVEEYASAVQTGGQAASGTDELDFDFGGHSDGEPLDGDADGQAGGGGVNSALATSKLSTKKKEALSQVPCKFFRSNGCSAGNACPFAHIQPGEGQGKAICQWFLKGNCRFGHRCALAHILPGQPMSMDRKNKRAAQQQQQNGANVGHHQGGGAAAIGHAKRTSQPHHFSGLSRELAGNAANGHYGTLPSYALTRDGGGVGGDLMFGALDDLQYPGGATSAATQQAQRQVDWQTSSRRSQQDVGGPFDGITLPTSMAVGSPMNAQVFGTSPFSQPGSHSVFFSGSQKDADRTFGRSHPRNEEDEALRRAAQRSWGNEEDNAEEFLPSSLSDLLTPTELERRRRSVLGSKNQWLSKAASSSALGGSIASQSVPASSNSNMVQTASQGGNENDNLWNRSSTNLDAGMWNGSGMQAGARFGASNTSTGFLTSRIGNGSTSVGDRVDADAQRSFHSYSPDARAALNHAPGQSLPQGLAAGLSRLHLRSDAANGSAAHARLTGDAQLQHGADSTIPSSSSPGVIGGQRVGHLDDLAPVAPSSIFAHRGTPLHQQFGRSAANSSLSASLTDAHSTSQLKTGNSFGFSPLPSGGVGLHSPALRAEQGGIAIPNGSATVLVGETGSSATAASTTTTTTTHGHPHSFTNHNGVGPIGLPHHHKHPGLHRVRAGAGSSGAGIGASPLALPTTGEEVEEAIFELE